MPRLDYENLFGDDSPAARHLRSLIFQDCAVTDADALRYERLAQREGYGAAQLQIRDDRWERENNDHLNRVPSARALWLFRALWLVTSALTVLALYTIFESANH